MRNRTTTANERPCAGLWSALLVGVGLLASPAQAASDWPSRPIHIIVPYAAGGPTDLTIRTLAPVVSTALGQTVVVENKLGGATMTATQVVVAADPDGYTIGAAAAPLALNTALGVATPYDPLKDLQYVVKLVDVPACILVNPRRSAIRRQARRRAGLHPRQPEASGENLR
jgi:tripartite-type tricarboxylate transporter receptor subunit TctC